MAQLRVAPGGEHVLPKEPPQTGGFDFGLAARNARLAAGGDAQLGHGWLVRRSCRSGAFLIAAGVSFRRRRPGARSKTQNPGPRDAGLRACPRPAAVLGWESFALRAGLPSLPLQYLFGPAARS